MEFIDVIMSRHSVRSFRNDPIPEEQLHLILEAGRNAPSYQNKQCWRFLVINDNKFIREIAAKSGIVGKVNFFIKDAPVLILACADPDKSGGINGQSYYLVDTAIAFQQMMLTAWNFGIGSCWLAAFDEVKVKQALMIPQNIRIVAMSPFGYPLEKEKFYGKMIKFFAGSKNRKDTKEIICYNKWSL